MIYGLGCQSAKLNTKSVPVKKNKKSLYGNNNAENLAPLAPDHHKVFKYNTLAGAKWQIVLAPIWHPPDFLCFCPILPILPICAIDNLLDLVVKAPALFSDNGAHSI